MARRHQPAGAAGNHSTGTNAVASDNNSVDPPIIIAVAEGRKSQIVLAWIDLAIPNKISVHIRLAIAKAVAVPKIVQVPRSWSIKGNFFNVAGPMCSRNSKYVSGSFIISVFAIWLIYGNLYAPLLDFLDICIYHAAFI
jgi:hypothetical protein